MAKKKSSSAEAQLTQPVLDPTVRYAVAEIDGERYHLTFDFNAIAIAEQQAGVNLLQALGSLTALSAAQFRGLLFAALTKAHPALTVDDVGKLIRLDTVVKLQLGLSRAYRDSMPESTENPPRPAADEPPPANL